ncbi:tubulin-tyrosine ligase family protein [Nitzschia inconspicua]|uniref:Tubulin-tyrosine ligase family protein n=1 Tax=Nitzschia inconspicua TaxID=303405 RepID=A0A9K3KGB5_9STRA|nr:tubulin-tyrosine ligase family protein [Nitzschia inconspicua]
MTQRIAAYPIKLLVVCDLQTVALNSLPKTSRLALLDFIRMVLLIARANTPSYHVIWNGLAFSSDYIEISESHKVFGALKRMNRMTSGASRFFVKVEDATNFALLPDANDSILWRSSLMPPNKEEWKSISRKNNSADDSNGIYEVTVVGIRTSQSILSTVQSLCDLGWKVTVIEECILDDNEERHKAAVTHLLPIYADVVRLAEWMEMNGTNDSNAELINTVKLDSNIRYLCDCGRGGHSFLYQQHLLMFHEGWAKYPLQPWYSDTFNGKSYTCPLGKRIIDFCDEPQFSEYCMYIKGREWLDEKDKLWELVPEIMPRTYVIDKGSISGEINENGLSETANGPFFLKECMKNGGKAVQVYGTLTNALDMAKKSNSTFVVQEHLASPMLTALNQKCHIKSYFLLVEDAGTWELRMYPEAFLSVSPNTWTTTDLSTETQITVKRTRRLYKNQDCDLWPGWPSSYSTVRDLVVQTVERAVTKAKLGTRGQSTRQFEIFSADVMVDTSGRGWLIECNFGCVLFDPKIGQPLTTIGLQTYQKMFESQGDTCEVNDHAMIAETVKLVFDQSRTSKWELVGTFSQ